MVTVIRLLLHNPMAVLQQVHVQLLLTPAILLFLLPTMVLSPVPALAAPFLLTRPLAQVSLLLLTAGQVVLLPLPSALQLPVLIL
jgi:hypothetical protein